MRRAPADWWIWIPAAAGAAVVVTAFAWRQLWLQPREDAGNLAWWLDLPLDVLSGGLLLAAVHLPMLLTGRGRPSPAAFIVEPGRFVAPPVPWLRAVATEAALIAWGLIPVFMLSWRNLAPGASTTAPAAAGVLLGLASTVIAWRVRRRSVTLTPQGIVVREVWDTDVKLPWDRAASDIVADPRSLRWIDARFLSRAIDHYWAVPEHRAAIGTPEEHDRLTALLAQADLTTG